jgi:ADP-ribose pyrophosphatase YjhB (NUDIX family)
MMIGSYVTSCLACTIRSNLVLMVEQEGGYWAGRWILPGGKLELGEGLEECAARECYEETHVKVAISRQVKAYVSYDPNTEWDKQVLLICFEAEYLSGFPHEGQGVTGAKWIEIDKIKEMNWRNRTVPDIILQMIADTLGSSDVEHV